MFSQARKTIQHYRNHGLQHTARVVYGRASRLWEIYFPRAQQSQGPANYGIVVADDARIEADARYALQVTGGYLSSLEGGVSALRGKTVLELGPGLNLATVLILRCWGAGQVAVADRFLVRYQRTYHTQLYERIAKLLKDQDSWCNTEPLERCAAARRHLPEYLTQIEVPLEKLSEATPLRFDITFSNAVLEHVYHPLLAISSLAKISRPGSVGFHQIDCRDHRDFSRPLEYLLLDEFSFHALMTESHTECGNRIRPDELLAMFEANFDEVQFTPNMWAEQEYLEQFLPRLRDARSSAYSDIDPERLRQISGRFKLTMKR